jgi:uncharacterized protein (DUF58 family)
MLIALGVPLGAVAAQAGLPWFWIAYDALAVAVLATAWMLGPSGRSLRLERRFDPVLSVRVPNRIQLRLRNDGVEAMAGRLRDEPPPRFEATTREFEFFLGPGRESILEYSITPDERGSDYFRGTWIRLRCPLGIVMRQARLRTEQPIRIYPNVLALREFDLLKQRGRLTQIGIRKSRMKGLGTEFESLREYTEGDDYRKIDWKASARRGKLVVKQFEQERNQAVILVIDVGRTMLAEIDGVTKLDHTLDACLMLTHAAATAGDQVGLLVYADVVRRFIAPRKGRRQVAFIIEALHDLLAEPVESDATSAMAYLSSRWKRRSLVVAFSDADDSSEARELVTAFGASARRHLLLMARIADPGLKVAASKSVSDAEGLFSKAAALLVSEDRRTAGSLVEASGMHTLESEPQDLAAALVSFYFQVKERSLL